MSGYKMHQSFALQDCPRISFAGYDDPIPVTTIFIHIEDNGKTALTFYDAEGGSYFPGDVNEPHRWSVTTGDDEENYKMALGLCADEKLVYLDDPDGKMVGFLWTEHSGDVIKWLNREHETEEGDWRLHDADWDNCKVLLRELGKFDCALLHDNDKAEVVGFIFRRAERQVADAMGAILT